MLFLLISASQVELMKKHNGNRCLGSPEIGGAKEENFVTNLFDLCFSVDLVCWKCSDKSEKI